MNDMNLYLKTRHTTKFSGFKQSRERGSTVLLVLAMLTILLLLGIAFSYSTRLETQASTNYAQLAQARTSAATGLPMALPLMLKAAQGITTPLQSWSTVPQYVQKLVKGNGNGKGSQLSAAEMAALNKAGVPISQDKDGQLDSAPQANISIRDLSGMVNVNAVKDQAAMERVVTAVMPGGNVRQKSAVLLALRGDLEQVNTASRDVTTSAGDKTKNLDVRDPSAVLLDSLDRLKYGGTSGRAAFTDAEVEKLATNVTIFSQSPEMYNLPDGETHVPRIPLDSLEPRQVFNTLRQAFPGKKKELLLQFTANLIDFSDDDNEPTVLDDQGDSVTISAEMQTGLTLGVEMTPLISEVYPDAETSIGFDDDGQFVEIVNPWSKSISLAGWSLRSKAGVSVPLTATLPGGGYLIITDNYDTPKPDVPPGHGSVVSIFGATANGSSKQFMVYPTLDLTDRNGSVSLYDAEGNLVDVFAYGTSGSVDGKKSFQRKDPMVRGYDVAEATPMAAAAGVSINADVNALTEAWEEGNTTMTRVSQLFAISTGFAESNGGVAGLGSPTGAVYPGQLAQMSVPNANSGAQANAANSGDTDPLPTNLDLRLVDVFTATRRHTETTDTLAAYEEENNSNSGRSAYEAFRRKMERLRERNARANAGNATADAETTSPVVYSYGKLNVNTCNKAALLGLSLNTQSSKMANFASFIEEFEGHRLTSTQQGKAAFLNVSDFITMFVENLSRSNRELLDDITDQIAVGSSSFEVIATNRLSPKEQAALDAKDNTSGPRPATASARWIISLDQQPYSVVSFTSIP